MLHSLVAVTASTGCEGNAGAVAGCGQHAETTGKGQLCEEGAATLPGGAGGSPAAGWCSPL